MDDEGDDDPVPLPNVNAATLEKVIPCCTHHKSDLPPPEDDENKENRTDDIPVWDQEFLQISSRKSSVGSISSTVSSKIKVPAVQPIVKKDKRQSSSRFSASSDRELQKLPSLKVILLFHLSQNSTAHKVATPSRGIVKTMVESLGFSGGGGMRTGIIVLGGLLL
ncbi:S-phase kinase-associated protein 1 [Myotis davidii]|uniref:S-phase kinase-associated protein 1 n=1 Tax=Myotis davidii TaxID=225400 RepID=L5LPS3_MYODS|nr:S-phase kinase-associated protein 1 [Myotis davidii]